MDQIFDRLGNLLKSILNEDETPESPNVKKRYGDQDMQDAWEELDNFLSEDDANDGSRENASGAQQSHATSPKSSYIPPQIKQDYANLDAPVGASLEEVRKSYKRLLVKYHPDRHALNPERFETATKVTQKINESFQRIKKFLQTGSL